MGIYPFDVSLVSIYLALRGLDKKCLLLVGSELNIVTVRRTAIWIAAYSIDYLSQQRMVFRARTERKKERENQWQNNNMHVQFSKLLAK